MTSENHIARGLGGFALGVLWGFPALGFLVTAALGGVPGTSGGGILFAVPITHLVMTALVGATLRWSTALGFFLGPLSAVVFFAFKNSHVQMERDSERAKAVAMASIDRPTFIAPHRLIEVVINTKRGIEPENANPWINILGDWTLQLRFDDQVRAFQKASGDVCWTGPNLKTTLALVEAQPAGLGVPEVCVIEIEPRREADAVVIVTNFNAAKFNLQRSGSSNYSVIAERAGGVYTTRGISVFVGGEPAVMPVMPGCKAGGAVENAVCMVTRRDLSATVDAPERIEPAKVLALL